MLQPLEVSALEVDAHKEAKAIMGRTRTSATRVFRIYEVDPEALPRARQRRGEQGPRRSSSRGARAGRGHGVCCPRAGARRGKLRQNAVRGLQLPPPATLFRHGQVGGAARNRRGGAGAITSRGLKSNENALNVAVSVLRLALHARCRSHLLRTLVYLISSPAGLGPGRALHPRRPV